MTDQASDLLKIALPQVAPVWLDKRATLEKAKVYIEKAARENAQMIAFGEALVPGYPFWVEVTGGAAFNDTRQKELHAFYQTQSVCIEDGDLDDVCALLKNKKHGLLFGDHRSPARPRSKSILLLCLYWAGRKNWVRSSQAHADI